jgi:hypothetical protein
MIITNFVYISSKDLSTVNIFYSFPHAPQMNENCKQLNFLWDKHLAPIMLLPRNVDCLITSGRKEQALDRNGSDLQQL